MQKLNSRWQTACIVAGFALLSVIIFNTKNVEAQPKPLFTAGELIVKYNDSVSATTSQANIHSHGDQLKAGLPGIHAQLIELHGKTVAQGVALYAHDPHVAYVEPNLLYTAQAMPNDPSFNQEWGLLNTGQTVNGQSGTASDDIKVVAAWDCTTGSTKVVVGIVDSGISYTHADLQANVWSNPGGIGGCAIGTHGYNAITNSCTPLDDFWHGTHTAGTIGAVGNNGVGVTGVNWHSSLMGLKFLDPTGNGSLADAVKAITFAVQAKQAGVNIRVLSNSWGNGVYSQALFDAINLANTNNILFVAAAGNNRSNNDTTPFYPASYNLPNIISVAATDNRDALASFSNYGSTSVDLAAPGVGILSTVLNNGYLSEQGTSMAAPHVAGAAALLLADEPTLTTAALKSRLLSSVDPIKRLASKMVSGGRLNVKNALGTCSTQLAGSSGDGPDPIGIVPDDGGTIRH